MNRICIIGGAGFVGSYLTELLSTSSDNEILIVDNLQMSNNIPVQVQNSENVRLEQGDASDCGWMSSVVDDFRPKIIWHLAANSDIKRGAQDTSVDLNNTLGTTSALLTALTKSELRPEKVIFSSTSAIYGQHSGPISEGSARAPNSAYGWMKLASEFLLQQALRDGHIGQLRIFRFPNVTGARQTHGVVKDLVKKYHNQDLEWNILGDGNQTKPYVHVSELSEILVRLSELEISEPLFEVNVAPKTGISVREICRIIDELGQLKRTPIFGDSPSGWPGDVPNYSYDTSALDSLSIRCSESNQAIHKSVSEEMLLYKRD